MRDRKTQQLFYQQLEARLVLSSLRIANWNVGNGPNDRIDDANFETVIDAIGTQEVLGTVRPIDILVLSETDTDSNQRLNDVFDNFYGTGFESTISSADGGGDRVGPDDRGPVARPVELAAQLARIRTDNIEIPIVGQFHAS